MQVPRHRPVLAAALFVGLVALAGCSQVPTAPSPAAQEPLSSPTVLAEMEGPSPTPIADDPSPAPIVGPSPIPLVVSKLIDGRLGGVIAVGNWKLVVPDGAYVGIGTITIKIPDPSVEMCELEIYPSLLNNFKKPVDLRYLCTTNSEARDRNIQWWDPGSKTWRMISSWPESSDNSRCAELEHFSTYKSGKAGW